MENACNQKALKGISGLDVINMDMDVGERPGLGFCFGLGLDNLQAKQQQQERDRVYRIWGLVPATGCEGNDQRRGRRTEYLQATTRVAFG